MEVDRIPSKSERLTDVRQLDVLDTAHDQFLVGGRRVHNDVGSELIGTYLLTEPSLETSLSGEFTWKVSEER